MASKNKGNSGDGKPPVDTPDEFVSGTMALAEKLEPHAKTIAAAVAGVFLVLAGWYTYQYLGERAQAKATVLYQQALGLSQRPVSPEDPAKAADGEADAAAAAQPEEFPSYEARSTAVLAVLETLQAEHGSTRTAKSARLLQGSVLYELGRYQEAIDTYRAYLADAPTPELQWVARENLGYAQEAMAMALEDASARQAGLEQALETFRQIQPGETGPHRDYALYHEARILAVLGKNADAIAALNKALEVAPDGILNNDIKQRLAQLESQVTE